MNHKNRSYAWCLVLTGLVVLACGGQTDRGSDPSSDDQVALVLAVAQEYVDGYYHQFPEDAYMYGYPNPPVDRFGDHSPEALAAWHSREDTWIATLGEIDPGVLEGTDAAIPYAFILERLEASHDLRVCRFELWTMSRDWLGWYESLPANFSGQAVGTDEAREASLARAKDVKRFIDTDIANLRQGLSLGFIAPRSRIEELLLATESLLEGTPEASPFLDPAIRDGTEDFADSLLAIVRDEINPAISRYCEFLRNEYLHAARDSIGTIDTPGSGACYAAAIRFHTSLTLSPEEIHQIGLREMERVHEEMRVVGRRGFGIDDPKKLLHHVRTDPIYRFSTEQEILEYTRTAVDRSIAAAPDWFGFVPEADVIVRAFPKYLKVTGGGLYTAASPDGTLPAKFEIGTYEPEKLGRAEIEAFAFHEGVPGHHLQSAVAMEGDGLHPALRYFFFNGTGEGWALYTERLADEMGLYTSDLSQIGRLSFEALRVARLVVDTGMHALGWTRQEAIDYMLENTALGEGEVSFQIDRYVTMPAQAVSYMIGSLEIQHLRSLAEERLGDRFDVRAFHDTVLEDGTVTLEMLRRKIERWVEGQVED